MSNDILTLPAKSSSASDTVSATRWRKRMTGLGWFTIALVVTITFAFPLYFMVINSFKPDRLVMSNSLQLIPTEVVGLANYQTAFEIVPLARFFFNSALTATIDVIVTVFFSALAGYGFAKFKFRGQKWLFLFILITMTVPFQILL